MKLPKLSGWRSWLTAGVVVLLAIVVLYQSLASGKNEPKVAENDKKPSETTAEKSPSTDDTNQKFNELMEVIKQQGKAIERLQNERAQQQPAQQPANGNNELAQAIKELASRGNVNNNAKQTVYVGSTAQAATPPAPIEKASQVQEDFLSQYDIGREEKISRLEDDLDKHEYQLKLALNFKNVAPRGPLGDLERLSQEREIKFRQKEISRIKKELLRLDPKKYGAAAQSVVVVTQGEQEAAPAPQKEVKEVPQQKVGGMEHFPEWKAAQEKAKAEKSAKVPKPKDKKSEVKGNQAKPPEVKKDATKAANQPTAAVVQPTS